jgi:uncharacterized protein (TIGR03790 family)
MSDKTIRQLRESVTATICWFVGIVISLGACGPALGATESGAVVVIYNSNLKESKGLAEYYAKCRQVPADRVWGFDLPNSETMTRKEFRDRLERPLLKKLEKAKLMTFRPDPKASSKNGGATEPMRPAEAVVRYATLCYGVPLRIAPDPKLEEEGAEMMRSELRRNEAAVDSELALLPLHNSSFPLFGPFPNRTYGTTNAALLNPTNGLLMVARLDGPSVEIARNLIAKSIQAETDGLWGRAYFDARGLTNGPAKTGDDWIRGAAELTRHLGFEAILDDKEERFPVSFPMSQIAFYAGWYEYDGQVSGPFTRSHVEFMPGAFAYHLHSFSGQTIRSPTQNWVGPFLDKGATATMGCVYEPYLEFTPNIAVFFHRLIHLGFSFGEAAYACQPYLSWQTTVVGDPLYRPFEKKPQTQHAELLQRKNKLIEWSHLKVVNINLANDHPMADLIQYLQETPELQQSSVLLEKLADLFFSKTQFSNAVETYQKAVAQSSSEQQKIRLTLSLGRTLEFLGKPRDAYEVYQRFPASFPNYPDMAVIYRKLISLADQLNLPAEKEQHQRALDRLLAPVPAKS